MCACAEVRGHKITSIQTHMKTKKFSWTQLIQEGTQNPKLKTIHLVTGETVIVR